MPGSWLNALYESHIIQRLPTPWITTAGGLKFGNVKFLYLTRVSQYKIKYNLC